MAAVLGGRLCERALVDQQVGEVPGAARSGEGPDEDGEDGEKKLGKLGQTITASACRSVYNGSSAGVGWRAGLTKPARALAAAV